MDAAYTSPNLSAASTYLPSGVIDTADTRFTADLSAMSRSAAAPPGGAAESS